MSFGILLLLVEALTVYGLVFTVHAVRDRFTLAPYYALLGVLAATLRWTTDAGIQYQVGPLTFILGSVVFFTAILFGVFLLYIFDGVQAAQIGIYTVVAVSVLSPALAMLFQYQLAEMGAGAAERIILSPVRIYVSSTGAMVLDFLFIAMVWELFTRHLERVPAFIRIATCLLSTLWLDVVLFTVAAFWGEPGFQSILEGNLISRLVLTGLVSPILTSYIVWEKRRQHHQFTPRTLMAILHRSAQREMDLFVAHREIEERRRMERELRISEERLDLALQGGDLGLWDWDIETDRVVFNERWARMLGYEPKAIEPSSRAWERLMHPEDGEPFLVKLRAHLKGETPHFESEHRMCARDGTWRWILNKGKVVVRDGTGRALRATGTHLDITRQKETEEALRFSQEMFRLMFEESPLGIIRCGLDGAFVQANRAFLNMVGYTEEALRGHTYFDLSPRDHEREEAEIYRAMQETGRFGPFELAYIRSDGRRVPVLANGSLVTGADGKQYIWSIVEDISERKAAEQALADARLYQREIETRIEETLLRGRPPEALDGADVAAVNVPTEHMDGDFADFVRLNDRCFDVLVGDVMGKGILAALVSAGAKSHFLRALSTQLAAPGRGAYPRPAALVEAVHRRITRQLIDLDCFLTLCYARFDLEAGTVTYVDCGHTKTIRYRVPAREWKLLEGDNLPIGVLEAESYRECVLDVRPGDIFFFYSDGLTDSRSADGAMFGVDRLIECIGLHASMDAAALTRKVIDTVRQFSGPNTRTDDQTCVAVKVEDTLPDVARSERLAIASSVEHLVTARGFLSDYLDRQTALLGSADEFNRVILAFVEALSNIIRHSFSGGSGETITIEVRSNRNRLHIAIQHRGKAFRPRSTPLPDPGAKREGGYGLYIMNRCFDHIRYETADDGAECILLIKRFNVAASG